MRTDSIKLGPSYALPREIQVTCVLGASTMTLDPRGEVGITDVDLSIKADVGSTEGTTWLLSSAKARNGVAQLMDDDLDTLWQ